MENKLGSPWIRRIRSFIMKKVPYVTKIARKIDFNYFKEKRKRWKLRLFSDKFVPLLLREIYLYAATPNIVNFPNL